jgi:GntR family transcriptional regulator, arabinose operon transcriptional repressor
VNTPPQPAGSAARGHKTRLLADDLRRGIAELRWPAGRLPTEQQLAREQGVSVNTVRRAVDLLVHEGLVHRRQGSGMYIAPAHAPGSGPVVGVVVPSLTYYFPRVIAGIERELARRGSQMLLRSTDWDPAAERDAVDGLVRSGAAGLLLVPGVAADGSLPGTRRPRDAAVPVVLVERGMELPVALHEFVCSHHAGGARLAVEHLLALGHTRIGYLERQSPHTAPRVRAGVTAALEAAGLGGAPATTASLARWTARDADGFLARLLRAGGTAALCFADREASLLVAAARRRGVDVPGELSVIGYDDETADLCEVPLTAVSPAKTEIGARAVDVLRQRLAHPEGPLRQEALVPRLVLRESTAPAAGSH